MKHIKRLMFDIVVVSLFTMAMSALVTPWVLMVILPEKYPGFFSYFSVDHSFLWIITVFVSVMTAVTLNLLGFAVKVKKAKRIIKAMVASNVTFEEAYALVEWSYHSGENPDTWDQSDFVRDLERMRQRRMFD